MRLEEVRPGVFSATFSAHELSVLLAGAHVADDTDPQGRVAR
jgi:hypothetical protein